LIVAGCSSGSSASLALGSDAPIASAAATAASSPASAATGASQGPLLALRVTGTVIGSGTYPPYTVRIPSQGWSAGEGLFIIKDGPAVVGLSVWDVGQVPRDPCKWAGSLIAAGETVDELVRLLVAQEMRDPSVPTDVTIDGHAGKYLEWSVPADAVVSGDSDFRGCDGSEGHQDFVSWFPNGEGVRYQQVAGQVDRLWVLDVRGQRLVIDATFSPNATPTDRAELDQVAESLRFGAP
jgi:hypothetical protein